MAEKANEKVDLNKASRDQLVAVPGIGPAAADAILKHREEQGRFKSVDDLREVPGVGAATFENARPHLSVSGKGAEGGDQGQKAAETARKAANEQAEVGRKAANEQAETAKKATDANVEVLRRAGTKAAEAGQEATERTMETAQRVAQANVETLQRLGNREMEAFRSLSRSADQGYREMAALGQRNVDAAIASSRAVFEGWRNLNQEWVGFVQTQLREGVEASQALSRCRSLKEVVEVQNDFARASMDRFVNETVKITDLAARIVNDSLTPLQARAEQAAQETARNARA
jgi:competence ComEA-like helix-hairpin-helix protein/phasin family protein